MIKLDIYKCVQESFIGDDLKRYQTCFKSMEYPCKPNVGDYIVVKGPLFEVKGDTYLVQRVIVHEYYVEVWVTAKECKKVNS